MDHGDICIWVITEDLLDLVGLPDMRDFAVVEGQGQKDRLMGMVGRDLRGLGLVGLILEVLVLEVLVLEVLDLKGPMVQGCRGLDMDTMDTMAQVVDQAGQAGMEDGSLILSILSRL
jgi:uncharacterized membrane protein